MQSLRSTSPTGRSLGVLAVSVTMMLSLFPGCARREPMRVVQSGVVEAACGQCLFHLPGKGCNLAIRYGGRAHFVDGVDLDSLGDAHASDGMCQVIRQARVSGEFRNGRFIASSLQLLPIQDSP